MRKLIWILTAVTVLMTAGCTNKSEQKPPDAPGNPALQKVLRAYVVEFLRRNPTTNTYLGGAGFDPSLRDVDGTLRNHSANALADEDRWLTATETKLQAIDAASLTPETLTDRDVARAQISFMLHQHHVRRYKVLTGARDRVSPVRWLTPGAVEDSSSMCEDSMAAEGWGLYAEALMAEPQPGAPQGFYTPEERLYQLQGKLYRDLRVRIDTGIHTGRITYDDAVTLFSETVDFLPGPCSATAGPKRSRPGSSMSDAKRASCESSERAIFRYSKWPTQAITYRLGKDQIYALRAEAATMLGDKFSAKTFHLLFITQGTIPPGYFRDWVLSQLLRQPQ